jgi:RNA polymerase sigma-70 factor (ECF subfamily)
MDEQRLGRLIDELAPALLAMARGRCRDAEDVVQQAFVALIGQAREPENPAAWLFGAVRQLALARAREEGRRERREEAVARAEGTHPPDPARTLDLAEALAALDADDRDMVLARVHGGLSFEEIGHLAGISASTAWRRYRAAMETVRARMEGWNES